MDKQMEQLQYWKGQYEKLIDENIRLKEKAIIDNDQISNNQKIDCLQQENYQLKQSQLRLKRDVKQQNEELLQQLAEKDEMKQQLNQMQNYLQDLQQNKEKNSMQNNMNEMSKQSQAFDSIYDKQKMIQNKNKDQQREEFEEELKIKDCLIKELRNKISYDEDNMLLLKGEFQKKISKIEKQSRIGEIQSENIMLKQEIQQNQAIIASLTQPNENNKNNNNTQNYYHSYVKLNKEQIQFLNELSTLLNIQQLQLYSQLFENKDNNNNQQSDITFKKDQIFNSINNILTILNDSSQVTKEVRQFLQQLHLQPILNYLDIKKQQQLTIDIQKQDNLIKQLLQLENSKQTITNTPQENKQFLNSSINTINNQQPQQQITVNKNLSKSIFQQISTKLSIEQIQLDNIPALHLAKLYQTQIYLSFQIKEKTGSQITQMYSLQPQSSSIEFNQDKIVFELTESGPQYLEVSLYDRNNLFLGKMKETLVTNQSKQIDQEVMNTVNYILGTRIKLIMKRT